MLGLSAYLHISLVFRAYFVASACLHVPYNHLHLGFVRKVKELPCCAEQLLQLLCADAMTCDCQEASCFTLLLHL